MNRHRDVLAVLGLALLVPPSYFMARWIRIYYEVSGHEQRVAAFLSGFPGWLRDTTVLTLVAFAFAAVGVLVGLSGLAAVTGLRRWIYAALVALGGLLALWLAWTLL